MKSKFRFFTYLTPLIAMFLIAAISLFGHFSYSIMKDSSNSDGLIILLFPAVFLFSLWYFIYVLRFKCDVVVIEKKDIIINKFFGLGFTLKLPYNELQLYPSWEHVKLGTGNKILVYKGDRRITELSDFSYSNYKELIGSLKKHKGLKLHKKDSMWMILKIAIGIN